jgi:hypothetical protein
MVCAVTTSLRLLRLSGSQLCTRKAALSAWYRDARFRVAFGSGRKVRRSQVQGGVEIYYKKDADGRVGSIFVS